ncbi:hypothetical protein GOBAR_AA23485 [Gossypium barbadense]|uniref:Uncharacterized protein n=1 Tax=Gossypium barbadense TaxID=3634 RepID=A0A2P5X1K3_GOSBA|nr:hypothetical protein GOBAR_AA23485 [Gossypium barbadense]
MPSITLCSIGASLDPVVCRVLAPPRAVAAAPACTARLSQHPASAQATAQSYDQALALLPSRRAASDTTRSPLLAQSSERLLSWLARLRPPASRIPHESAVLASALAPPAPTRGALVAAACSVTALTHASVAQNLGQPAP